MSEGFITPPTGDAHAAPNGVAHPSQATSNPVGQLQVRCGPLLNYKRMSNAGSATPTWHGSVLIVTTPGGPEPSLSLRCVGAFEHGQASEKTSTGESRDFRGEKLYEDPRSAFWRFVIDLPMQSFNAQWEYHIPNLAYLSGASANVASTKTFFVPPASESMRIMFHSCNGFSVGTDEDAWSGCALWNDVLRMHEKQPFHVMIGGGDQIYNDGIRVDGPLKPWTDIASPHKRREFPFNEKMRAECDTYYHDNYVKWYSTEPFSSANATIAQLNIWDDHDIIDGFGSYTDHFMKCSVFRGIGGVAHKYYLLFQHHVPPPKSTYTTDAPQTMNASDPRADPVQMKDTYVMTEKQADPSFIFGARPGPYVEEKSMSMYCQLGAHVAFAGLDARTERTRHQINYPDTYDIFFNHIAQQIEQSHGQIKHFILLLGVPIAYPRLQWLENIFQSPIMGPVRFLNKRFGFAGGLFNNFDGGVDLMDDLDDHYTAHQHKKERKDLVLRLQKLAEQHSVRVTILGGDVHLAAHGRFYSNPKDKVAVDKDFRYMANIVSSAITNKPPPQAVANLLARRNKIHHLDHHTHETLLNLFDKNPGVGMDGVQASKKTADANKCTMPSRNFAVITESHANPGSTAQANGEVTATDNKKELPSKNPRNPIHSGEAGCGTGHPAADGTTRSGLGGQYDLDVAYRVEINQHDRKGWTEGYGLTVPALDLRTKA